MLATLYLIVEFDFCELMMVPSTPRSYSNYLGDKHLRPHVVVFNSKEAHHKFDGRHDISMKARSTALPYGRLLADWEAASHHITHRLPRQKTICR